jgi:UDP-N-acetylglucosamine 2-epimerase (non-hydrolysing)
MALMKVVVIMGTRPEAIKMAPIVHELQCYSRDFDTRVVVTAQHRSMLDQVLKIFRITPDYDLNLMLPGQSLSQITVNALHSLENVLHTEKPDLILVQGDTTTAFVGGLAAYYQQIAVGHVEAGLRTYDKYNPFPEEMNRHFLDIVSDLCFVPTLTAQEALRREGIPETRIFVTGNTVIDALLATIQRKHRFTLPELQRVHFNLKRQTILVTTHRRENFGEPLRNICQALRDLLLSRKNLQIIFPVHLNPEVRKTVSLILGDVDRAILLEPLDYLDFVHLMRRVDLVITDSGGVQEEAPALGKPVLVTRSKTERPEAVKPEQRSSLAQTVTKLWQRSLNCWMTRTNISGCSRLLILTVMGWPRNGL